MTFVDDDVRGLATTTFLARKFIHVSMKNSESCIFSLVMCVEVQPEAEALQALILADSQLEQKRSHHVLVAL
jgi:hypothetical protein